MLSINTNLMSLTAQQNVIGAQGALSQAINRLSSGMRINTAADDAAGNAVANAQTAALNSLNQGVANANDAVSMLQTANGALKSTVDDLQRINQLAAEAGDGSMNSTALNNLNTEVQARLNDISRIASQSTFNGIAVLSSAGSVAFQLGASAGQTLTVSFGTTVWDSSGLAINAVSVTDATAAQAAMKTISTALGCVNTQQANLGAAQNTLQEAILNTQTAATNTAAARSQLMDADFAQETANLSKAQVLQQAGISVLAQANQMPQQVLKLLG